LAQVLRVLQVEDVPDDAELVVLELERAGYTVQAQRVATAPDYAHALETRSWDAIVSDFTMPNFGGKVALEMLKARGIDVPFIIVSGSLGEDVAVEVMKAGAHDFFAKGNLKRLVAAVEREVREAGIRRQRLVDRQQADAERDRLLGELQAAVRARDMFLAIAAHELKTPLTSLQLYVEGLGRNDLLTNLPADKLEAKVVRIGRQVKRLTKLVDGMFEVARITSNKMVLSREAVDLAEVIDDVVRSAQDTLHFPEGQIVRTVAHVAGSWDRVRIETVVSNLISNAVKFGEQRPIEIAVSAEGDRARLVVADRGIGIAPEAQSRIFEKFERAVPISHYGGFGLGLWIARQIVEAHGGTIGIDGREGGGSAFTVLLPR